MLAATLASSLAALLALAATASAHTETYYEAVQQKGDSSVPLNTPVDLLVVRDGDCSVSLDKLVTNCRVGGYLHAVRVTATDRAPYPHVHVEDNLRSLTVRRATQLGGCRGNAYVNVELSCLY